MYNPFVQNLLYRVAGWWFVLEAVVHCMDYTYDKRVHRVVSWDDRGLCREHTTNDSIPYHTNHSKPYQTIPWWFMQEPGWSIRCIRGRKLWSLTDDHGAPASVDLCLYVTNNPCNIHCILYMTRLDLDGICMKGWPLQTTKGWFIPELLLKARNKCGQFSLSWGFDQVGGKIPLL